jgi:hypothetical protein
MLHFCNLKFFKNFMSFFFFVVRAAPFSEEQLTSINEHTDFQTIWTTLLSPHYSTVNIPGKMIPLLFCHVTKIQYFFWKWLYAPTKTATDCRCETGMYHKLHPYTHFVSEFQVQKQGSNIFKLLTYPFTLTAIQLMSEKNWFFLRNSK